MNKININGIETDQILLTPTRGYKDKHYHIVFIPGNPGTIYFYQYFLEYLHNIIEKQYNNVAITISSIGHANHHLKSNNEDINRNYQKFGMNYQIRHQEMYIEELILKECADDQIKEYILIGHSIGCYFILNILKRNMNISLHTRRICLLMPFMFWGNLPLLHRIALRSIVSTIPYSINTMKWYITTRFMNLNEYEKKQMITGRNSSNNSNNSNNNSVASPENVHVMATELITPRLIDNLFTMGIDEIKTIPIVENEVLENIEEYLNINGNFGTNGVKINRNKNRNMNPINVATNSNSMYVLYTDDDRWAPVEDIPFLQNTFGLLKLDQSPQCMNEKSYIQYTTGLTHGFSMNKNTSEITAYNILSYLSNSGLDMSPISPQHISLMSKL